MIYTIQNEALMVQVEDAGAQLASIRDAAGTEYLWQGDPAIWNRRAPLLFPIIARLKDSRYLLDGKPYDIPIHGFCRSAPFVMTEQSANSVTFRYRDTEETRRMFPFEFILTVTYTLEGNRLVKSHHVQNLSNTPMYYELGGHDGFRAPLAAGETMSDYAIRMPDVEAITPYGMDADKMITPKTVSYPLANGRMPLKPSAYDLDTIILSEFPQRRASLVDGKDRPRVSVDFGDFAYLGVWTATKDFDTNYVCIEPWTTLPDATFVGRELSEKAGIRKLAPGAVETLSYTVTIHSV